MTNNNLWQEYNKKFEHFQTVELNATANNKTCEAYTKAEAYLPTPDKIKEYADELCNGLKMIEYGVGACHGEYPDAGFCAISLSLTDLEDGHTLNWMDARNMEIVGNIFESGDLRWKSKCMSF